VLYPAYVISVECFVWDKWWTFRSTDLLGFYRQRLAFLVGGPSIWNDLPLELHSLLLIKPTRFYKSLNSFLFSCGRVGSAAVYVIGVLKGRYVNSRNEWNKRHGSGCWRVAACCMYKSTQMQYGRWYALLKVLSFRVRCEETKVIRTLRTNEKKIEGKISWHVVCEPHRARSAAWNIREPSRLERRLSVWQENKQTADRIEHKTGNKRAE